MAQSAIYEKSRQGREPVLCVLGGTGCGKSTLCHLLTGSDPRKEHRFFHAKSSANSVTRVVEIKTGLNWFDGEGKLTLVDCPGLADSSGADQHILDKMVGDLRQVPFIDIFVLMMSADRLAARDLIQNMKTYEGLCGGRAVWSNIVIVIPRRDYNPME